MTAQDDEEGAQCGPEQGGVTRGKEANKYTKRHAGGVARAHRQLRRPATAAAARCLRTPSAGSWQPKQAEASWSAQVMTVGALRPVNSSSLETSSAVPMMLFSTSCASSSNLEASSV